MHTARYETHNPAVPGSPGGRESANHTFLARPLLLRKNTRGNKFFFQPRYNFSAITDLTELLQGKEAVCALEIRKGVFFLSPLISAPLLCLKPTRIFGMQGRARKLWRDLR